MDTNNKKLCLIFDFTVHFAQILTTSGQLLVLVVAVAATASRPPFCSKAAPFSELFFPKVGRPTAWRRTSRVTMERMERRLMPLTRCTELAEVQSRLRLIIWTGQLFVLCSNSGDFPLAAVDVQVVVVMFGVRLYVRLLLLLLLQAFTTFIWHIFWLFFFFFFLFFSAKTVNSVAREEAKEEVSAALWSAAPAWSAFAVDSPSSVISSAAPRACCRSKQARNWARGVPLLLVILMPPFSPPVAPETEWERAGTTTEVDEGDEVRRRKFCVEEAQSFTLSEAGEAGGIELRERACFRIPPPETTASAAVAAALPAQPFTPQVQERVLKAEGEWMATELRPEEGSEEEMEARESRRGSPSKVPPLKEAVE